MESKLKVRVLTHTPEPEKIVASAAKLCYSRTGVENIMDNLTSENTEKFLSILVSMGHESPVEHISFTFAAEGVSRVLTHQLVRHRIASYSQQSQRYVKLDQFEYIIPPSIKNVPEACDMFNKMMEKDQEVYNKMTEILIKKHTEELIKDGLKEEKAKKAAEKMAIEDARYIFPNACETKIIYTMNARSLLNFFHERCCNRAQWEIRNLADSMLVEVKKIAPSIFKNAGPACLNGPCPEKSMSCGKIEEIMEKYNKLK